MTATVLMNPLLMTDRESYTAQELREVNRNKKNITCLANYVADMYIKYMKYEDNDYSLKLRQLIVCILEQYPETDVLIQKIIVPYTNRVYGKATPNNIGNAVDDIQMFLDEEKCLSGRGFISSKGETHVSVSLSFGLEPDELQHLGERRVLLPLINSLGRERTNLKNGGYLTTDLPAILKSKDHHDHPINLDALNKLQRDLVLNINWDYVEVIKDGSVDQYERIDTNKSLEEVRKVYKETGINPALRYVWQYDSRGRMYPHAYGLNPNGREYLKGMFQFPKRHLDDIGRVEILRYVGKCAGYDKFTYDVREEKAKILIDNFLKIYPYSDLRLMTSRERMTCYNNVVFGQYKDNFAFVIDEEEAEPYLLINALEGYFDDQLGLPVGTIMRQDATSSGIQLMGALDNCLKTLKMNNMIDGDKRYDSYTEGYEEIKPLFEINEGDKDISRDDMKYAIMTHFYCSERRPEQILEKNVKVFNENIGNIFPAGERVMNAILSNWEDREEFIWTMFDGHTAVYRPSKPHTGVVTLTINGADHKIPFKWYHNGKTGNFRHLPANIIQSHDGAVARTMVTTNHCIPNHDEFGSHPNDAVKVRQTYHNLIKFISENNFLDSILKELNPDYSGYVKSDTAKVGDTPFYSLS